jgi:hypothetical protein
LTGVDLPESLMTDLLSNIKRSISLHVVHLCGNQIQNLPDANKVLRNRLKPTPVDNMLEPDKAKLKLVE